MYKNLLELIKLIFGKSAINKTIGTRTNVIQLPNNKTKRYIKEDLNIEAASDAAAMNAKKEMEELIAEIPKMNDAERLIFESNLRRLKNRLGIRSETDPTADVFEFGTKEKVTPGGIASLTEQAGQKSPPGTLMGNIESRLNKLRASGEDLSTMKGQTLDEIMGDVMQTQKTMSKMQDEGLVRAAVRYKMMDDLKRGTLKLPKNLEDVVRGASNEEDVITVFRNNYGEDALEQVDSLIPDFYKMTSPADAVKKIEKDFPNMKPKKIEVKQTMDLDEAAKAEQENILTPGKAIPADSPEGKKITEALIGKPKAEVVSLPTAEKILSDMRNLGPIDAMKEANKVLKKEGPYKNLTDKDIEKIMDDINDHIFGGDLPVDPEDFANGGRVGFMDGGSKGLDYLTGVDRKGYADGSNYEFIKTLPKSLSDAINKFGFEAVIGKTVESGGGEAPGEYIPGKYTPYYSLMEAESGGGTGLKDEYLRILEAGPPKSTPAPAPAPAPVAISTVGSSPTASASAPVENFINDAVGTGAKEDPILDKYSLFVENYKPTAIPVSNYQTFVDQTGILKPHIQTAFSGLSPFFKQQYQTFATANPEKALEAALQDLKFLTATGNRPSYLQDGGRVGYSDGTKPSAEENTPSQAIINRMIAQIKQMSKMGSDIDTIKEITGASDQMIKDVLGKASGGSVSKGLDYLIGY
jgi:hypothetical protein